MVRGLRLKTGFTATEIFRKYLWYLLRERKFDEDAVADLSALRSVLAMRDEEVSLLLRSSHPGTLMTVSHIIACNHGPGI